MNRRAWSVCSALTAIVAATVLTVGSVATVHAQRPVGGRAYDHEALVVTSALAVHFDATKVAAGPAYLAIFTVECVSSGPCPVRFWADGTTPTASSGQRLGAGAGWRLDELPNVEDFNVIAESNSAKLMVQYYKVYAR